MPAFIRLGRSARQAAGGFRAASYAAAFLVGLAIGYAAWSGERAPVAALALGAVCAALGRPGLTLGLVHGYMLSTSAGLLPGVFRFLHAPEERLLGVAGWLAACLAPALIWSSCHALAIAIGVAIERRPNGVPSYLRYLTSAAGVSLAQGLLLMPALWSIGVGQPVHAAGYVFTAMAGVGAFLAIVLPAVAGSLCKACISRHSHGAIIFVIALLTLAWFGHVASSLHAQPIQGVHAFDTTLPSPRIQTLDAASRLPVMSEQLQARRQASGPRDERTRANASEPRLFVWPESTIAGAQAGLEAASRMELGYLARDLGASLLFGADRRDGDSLRVAARVMRPDGTSGWIDARLPMPIMLWRPWDSQASFEPANDVDPIVAIEGVGRVLLSICYEDTSAGLLMSGLRRRPDALVSIANNWWADSPSARAQGRAVESMALLYGVPLSRAVNWPVGR